MSNHKHFMVFGSILLASIMLISMLYVAAPVSNQRSSNVIAYNEVGSSIRDNITFTGNVAKDFSGHLIYHNTVTSLWGAENNISDLYLAYNSTYLFVGLNETVDGNNLMLFFSNDTSSGYGLYNLSKCSGANGDGGPQGVNFTSPINDLFTVYFSNPSTPDTPALKRITSTTSQSNTSVSATSVNMTYLFDATHNTTEIAIPFSSLYPAGNYSEVNLSLSTFVVGGGGVPGNWAWVGTGIPYNQTGKYNAGSTIPMFTINDSYVFTFHNISVPKPPSISVPINLNIMFNDHQPCYKVVGSNNYVLPWTQAHATAEYIEQALILHNFPSVNITYELSGVLLSQLVNISSDIYFNDTYIQGAFLPWSEVNASQSLYNNLTLDYFSIPNYVFDLNETASNLYLDLHNDWEKGARLTEQQFEDAKVLWFLYDVSTPLVEGQLGSSWTNSTMWSFHNMTSFNQSDLVKILSYSKWLVGQVIPAFKNDIIGNPNGSQNAELFTSPFYHPLVPLLLTTNLTGPDGTITKSSYYSDVMAQINVSFGQFNHLFGQYPSGLYSPEAAVTYEMIQAVNESGAKWFQSAQATLDHSGVDALAYGDSGSNVTTMENLYQPYEVVGPNNTTADMFFRDGYVSDQWGFDYGNEPTWTAVDNFINYLKNIYNEIPMSHHNQTVVSVLLDGENWMFMSPFVEDGVPFLEDLYTALEQNSSYIRTVTPSQYLEFANAHHITLKKINDLATASWNDGSGSPLPYENNVYLTQWAGDSVQDFYWQILQQVRSDVVAFQTAHNLVQLQNYTTFEQNMTANTLEGNLTRAWNAIYDAEGSDWYFTMAPWTIGGSNTIPFDYIFKGDLSYALRQINVPLPAFLTTAPYQPLTPYKNYSDSVPLVATLNGYNQYTNAVQGGLAFSVNNDTSWSYAAVYNATPVSSPLINNVSIDLDASDVLVQLNVSGSPSRFISGNNTIELFFSEPDQGYSSNISMDVQDSSFQTTSQYGSATIGFPALYMVTLAPSTFKNGIGEYNVYQSSGFGVWSYQFQDINVPAYIGSTIQFLIPFSYLNLVPGNSFAMAAFASIPGQSQYSMLSPMYQNIPLSLATYTPVSSIHNTVPAYGPGNYTYPNQPTQIPPGSLDMKWVNVSLNSFDMKWTFTFGQLWNIWSGGFGFSNQIVNIFISDGSSSGSTSLGPGPNANSTEPWQTMLYISGFSTYALTPSGEETNGITVSVNLTAGTVTAVFPSSYIGPDPLSYKYIIVSGSYDGYGVNGWRTVDAVNTSNGGWQGGGGDPPWSSNIYDYIAPATVGENTTQNQTQLLHYSVGHIPVLVPIKLPPLKNVTISSKSYFNPTEYNNASIVQFKGKYYVTYISDVSGNPEVYLSTSTNMEKWSSPKPVSGINNPLADQLISGNSNLYLLAMTKSGYSILEMNASGTWSNYYSSSTLYNYVSGADMNGNLYILSGDLQTNGTYNYTVTEISGGKISATTKLPFNSLSAGSITAFSGYLAVAYYSGQASNETIYVKVLTPGGMKVDATVTKYGMTNLTGPVAIASNPDGNIFIAFTSNVSGQYTISLTNTSAFKDPVFNHITTILVSASGVNNDPSIYLSNTGGQNYTVIMAWHSTTPFQNMVWAMNTTYSFQQVPVHLPTSSTSVLLYIIIGVVVAAVVIGAVSALYISRKKKSGKAQ